MTFHTVQFKTDWMMFPDPIERANILDAQIALRREYERYANPEYYRKTLAHYIAEGIKNDRS